MPKVRSHYPSASDCVPELASSGRESAGVVTGQSQSSEVRAEPPEPPLLIATSLREEGITGVHTHVRQFRKYLAGTGRRIPVITPFSWGQGLSVPVFGVRLVLARINSPASVWWYRYWHEVFLRQALRRQLRQLGPCVVYAQDPLAAKAALRVRRGPEQQVLLAVHFRISQADEWAAKGLIAPGGAAFEGIRRQEREIIPQVDGLVYVSSWAQDALCGWLPEALAVPSVVIDNFVSPWAASTDQVTGGDLVTVGTLEPSKNHAFLLRVLAEAKRLDQRYTLDVFGEGPLHKQLERLADSLRISDQVRLQGFRRDLRDHLPHHRAYVHASFYESSSLAIIEAMAAGLPIVAAPIGPIPELCDDGVEACFWSLDDPATAAATLVEFLQDEPRRLRAGEAARKRFGRDFDADVVAPRLLSFLMASDTRRVPNAGRIRSSSDQEGWH
jgi:glycosyltransferase involved in cell wall biosynthesis